MTGVEYMLQVVVRALRLRELPVFLDVAPQGTPYPFVVVQPVSSTTDYSLGLTQSRIENHRVQIAIYADKPAGMAKLMDQVMQVDLAIEGLTNVDFFQSSDSSDSFDEGPTGWAVAGTERQSTIGPRWLGSEHVWQYIGEWLVYVTLPTLLPGSPYSPSPEDMSSSSESSDSSESSESSVSSLSGD